MRRSNSFLSALVLAGALALPAVSSAQVDTPDNDQRIATNADRDNDGTNWGWLGLLGLAGLMGLKRKDRETHRGDHVTARQPL